MRDMHTSCRRFSSRAGHKKFVSLQCIMLVPSLPMARNLTVPVAGTRPLSLSWAKVRTSDLTDCYYTAYPQLPLSFCAGLLRLLHQLAP